MMIAEVENQFYLVVFLTGLNLKQSVTFFLFSYNFFCVFVLDNGRLYILERT